MSSNLDFEGVYDQSKRFMIHNWSAEDFTQHFGPESVYNDTRLIESSPAYDITIKAGDMREVGHFQAHVITRHFVDREMMRDAAKITDPKLRERAEMGMGNPILREPYEAKTISEIKPGEVSPFMDKLRAEIRAEEIAKMRAEVATPAAPQAPAESVAAPISTVAPVGEFDEAPARKIRTKETPAKA